MSWRTVFRLAIWAALLVEFVILALRGGDHLLWLLLVPVCLANLYWAIRPPANRPPPARFTESGTYRVVLQVPGNRGVQVIRQLRRTTGLDLVSAKKMLDDAPVVVAGGLSETSAELVADRLRAAGARALAAPIGEM